MRYLALLLLIPFTANAADALKPDPVLTPGEWNDPPTPLSVLCTVGHSKTVRHVTNSMKAEVFRLYGYDPHSVTWGNYEIDHLIALSLDGKNTVKNLWPQSYVTQPMNAHRKDVLENALHRMVCRGQLALSAAQNMIATDWMAAYQTYVLHKQ